jgi:hypothetical protein
MDVWWEWDRPTTHQSQVSFEALGRDSAPFGLRKSSLLFRTTPTPPPEVRQVHGAAIFAFVQTSARRATERMVDLNGNKNTDGYICSVCYVHEKRGSPARDKIPQDDILSLILMVGTFMVAALESAYTILGATLSMGRHFLREL